MLLTQAYQEIESHPGQQYQVFVQHPQNWKAKGWICVFKYYGSAEDLIRENNKADRFLGVFDSRIPATTFYQVVTQACLDHRFNKTRRTNCPTMASLLTDEDLDIIDDIRLGYV